ncbi:MAG: Mut7-C RNAse domain-containing protein [Anaerolineae bacterium]|nr:Mut7-C RNAse domain-containing protein [Anaerolineae bacterium]
MPKLLADAMLGKLARWLRLLGYDTAYMQAEDAAIAHRARAEGRVLLTRDLELARRRGLRTVLVRAETLEAQLAEVIAELGAPPPEIGPRCIHCNAPLAPISEEEASQRVPAYVAQTHKVFQRCPDCGRVYWRGTHWQSIQDRIDDCLEESILDRD